LLTARIQATGVFDAVFVSKWLVEMKTAESSRSSTLFPLYLTADDGSPQIELLARQWRPNLNSRVLESFAQRLGVNNTGDFGLPDGVTPEDIFQYTYGVLYSPGYRSRYAEFLKSDFPRLPLPGSSGLFHGLTRLGGELVDLHLMQSPKLDRAMTSYTGQKNPKIGRVGWSHDTVWLDAAATKKGQPATPGTVGFRGVPETVWNFHIGGYQVCHKWLKDRRGLTLADKDISHYQRIVVAIAETIRLMQEIDELIGVHGGWPKAFAAV
jgi:predicted helicase